MQNLGLQNILVPNVSTAGTKGNVAAKIVKGQSSDEFAQLLNGLQATKQSQAIPQNAGDILNLIAESFNANPEILDHIGFQGRPETLLGEAPVNPDSIMIKDLLTDATLPAADFTDRVEQLISQNPKLIAALKNNPQLAGNLNLEVIASEVPGKDAVQFKQELPFQMVKDFVAKVSNQKPEVFNMGRVVPTDRVNTLTLKQMAGEGPTTINAKPAFSKKSLATRAYADKQSQLDSNIIKLPSMVKEEETINPRQRIQGTDALDLNRAFMQQNIAQQGPTSAPVTQVIDLSSIEAKNPTELIQKISDYIQQNSITKTDGLDLLVKHNDLGQFRISVAQGAGRDQIEMQILTMSREGHDFFKTHEQGLLKALTHSGLQVNDLNIMTRDVQRNHGEFNNFSHNGNSHSDQETAFNHQSSENRDSERRRELWEEYRERFSA